MDEATTPLFLQLAEHLPDIIYRYRLSPTCGVEYVNAAVTAVTGYAPEAFYADPELMVKLAHPDDRPLLAALASGEIPSGAPLTFRWLRQDGRLIWVEQRHVLITDNRDTPVALEGIIRDVTAQREIEAEQSRLLRQAQAAEAFFRGLLEAAPDAIVIVDSDGRIMHVNEQAEVLFGYERMELLEQTVEVLVPERFRQAHVRHRLDYIAAPRRRPMGVGLDLFARRKDGSEIPVEISLSPLHGDGGFLVIAAIRDVSERKRSEAERARLLEREQAERARVQAILEQAPYGILFVEAASDHVLANPKARELFGRDLSPEEGRGAYLGALCDPAGRPLAREELASSRALEGQTVTDEEALIVRPDGRRIPVLASSAPIHGPTGEVTGAVVMFQDISALKALERLREEWALVVAHDLRQPIAAISLHASLLQYILQQGAPLEQAREAVGHITTAVNNLNKMVGDLLDFSRIEAQRLRLERVPLELPTLLRAVARRMGELGARNTVEVEVRGSIPTVQADPHRIEQVVSNLLSNAAKYSYSGTAVHLAVEAKDGEVEVSVTNEGPGIPPEELPLLFTRFYRVRRSREEEVAGLGLGLYISRGLVEAHGGRIWAESVPGQTTTFRFTLPLET